MKKKMKVLGPVMAAVILISTSVMGTMAYLTSADNVKNTFTVGNVAITLDETKVDEYGKPVANADRVKANKYKMIPGHTYTKDPMVTVLEGSEDCYVKMTLTYNKASVMNDLLLEDREENVQIQDVLIGYDSTKWVRQDGYSIDETNDTVTLTFYYNSKVSATPDEDIELAPLFSQIKIPCQLTKEQIANLEGLELTVSAYAVQADGFSTAEAAFDALNF